MRSSNYSKSLAHLVVLSPNDFGSRQVDKLHVSLRVDHEILGLNIAADYLVIVEVFKSENDACSVELAVLSGEQSDVAHNLVEIFTADVLLEIK